MGILNVPIDSPFIVFASRGPFYWQILAENGALISYHSAISYLQFIQAIIEVMAWLSNYIWYIYVNVITSHALKSVLV